MPVYEFAQQTAREVRTGLAAHLRIDKPPPQDRAEEEAVKIRRMSLRHREGSGRDNEVQEWTEAELSGKNVNLESIYREVEVACCRDAAYQPATDCVYSLIFHRKDHPNFSRFFFKVVGGQEINAAPAMQGTSGSGAIEKLMPDLLRYVGAKEEILERRSQHLWETLMKSNTQYASVIGEVTDRELRVRQVELGADDAQYERDKRRRKDLERDEMWKGVFSFLKGNSKMILPALLALRRGSAADGSQNPDFMAWYAERAEQKQAGDPKAPPKSPSPSTVQRPTVTSEAAEADTAPRSESSESAPAEQFVPTPLQQQRFGLAVSTLQTVMLLRGRGHIAAFVEAMTGEEKVLFASVEQACDADDVESEAAVEAIAGAVLSFGLAVSVVGNGGALLAALGDNASRISVIGLVRLIEAYGAALQAPAAAPTTGNAGEGDPPDQG